jgi:hypothetical protein
MTFASAVACIDGRIQRPVAEWVRRNYQVDHVDMVTEPGADAALWRGDETVTASVVRRLKVSRDAHATRVVAVSGHADCAANPVDEGQHVEHIARAAQRLRSLFPGLIVIGLWVDEEGEVTPVPDEVSHTAA